MDDLKIIELYFSRDESAIAESSKKYGNYCFRIAEGILNSREDSEECVSDTWLGAWNSIPPKRPDLLRLFFGRITRNFAIEKYRKRMAGKRGGGQVAAVLHELSEVLPERGGDLEDTACLSDSINRFLETLSTRDRVIFMRRYFYTEPIADIAFLMGLGRSGVAVILSRCRKKLKNHLESEGYTI